MPKKIYVADENLEETASAIASVFGVQPKRAIENLRVRQISDEDKVFELLMANGNKLPLLSAKQVADYSGLPLDQAKTALLDKYGPHVPIQGIYKTFS